MISNHALTNVAELGKFKNPMDTAKPGLEAPLTFACGVHDELAVTNGQTKPTTKPATK